MFVFQRIGRQKMKKPLATILLSCVTACSGGQEMRSVELKGKFNKQQPEPTSNVEAQPAQRVEEKRLIESQDETVARPAVISGSFLYCQRLDDGSVADGEAEVGCSVMRNNQKVVLNSNMNVNWGYIAGQGLEFAFTELPASAEYQVSVRIKAASSQELNNEISEVRIHAMIDQLYMEASITMPQVEQPTEVEEPVEVEEPAPAAPVAITPPASFSLRPDSDQNTCLVFRSILGSKSLALENCSNPDLPTAGVTQTFRTFSVNANGQVTNDGSCLSAASGSIQARNCDANAASVEFIGKQVRQKGSNLCLSSQPIAWSNCADGDTTQEWALGQPE